MSILTPAGALRGHLLRNAQSMRIRSLLAAGVTCLLTACQTLPQSAPPSADVPATATAHLHAVRALNQFQVSAKLAVQWAGKGYTARMQWQHQQPQWDDIAIFSPLGQQVARIQQNPQQVSLTDQQGQVHQAQDAGALTERLLGWRLPLQGLQYWMLGAPDERRPFQASFSSDGQLLRLLQDDWQIDYDPFATPTLLSTNNTATPSSSGPTQTSVLPARLPTELRLRQGDIRLKLVVLGWSTAPLSAQKALK